MGKLPAKNERDWIKTLAIPGFAVAVIAALAGVLALPPFQSWFDKSKPQVSVVGKEDLPAWVGGELRAPSDENLHAKIQWNEPLDSDFPGEERTQDPRFVSFDANPKSNNDHTLTFTGTLSNSGDRKVDHLVVIFDLWPDLNQKGKLREISVIFADVPASLSRSVELTLPGQAGTLRYITAYIASKS